MNCEKFLWLEAGETLDFSDTKGILSDKFFKKVPIEQTDEHKNKPRRKFRSAGANLMFTGPLAFKKYSAEFGDDVFDFLG